MGRGAATKEEAAGERGTCISSAGHLSPSTAHLSMKPAHRSRKASSTMSRFLCVKKSLHLGTSSYASARPALDALESARRRHDSKLALAGTW